MASLSLASSCGGGTTAPNRVAAVTTPPPSLAMPDPGAGADTLTGTWAGDRLLLVGWAAGETDGGVMLSYRPDQGEWRRLSPPPGGVPSQATALWNGVELLVVGGDQTRPAASAEEVGEFLPAGILAYDPQRDRWRRLTSEDLGLSPAVSLTSSGMLAWPGYRPALEGRLPPVEIDRHTGTVVPLPPSPLSPRIDPVVAYTGTEWLVWGGRAPDLTTLADGAAYDPARRRWRSLAPSPLKARANSASVWTGKELVVWGGTWACCPRRSTGQRASRSGGVVSAADTTAEPSLDTHETNDGASYDPVIDRWQLLPDAGLSPRSFPTPVAPRAVWTGSHFVVLGGIEGCFPACTKTDGAAFDPITRAWASLFTRLPPTISVLAWSGAELLVIALTNSSDGHHYAIRVDAIPPPAS